MSVQTNLLYIYRVKWAQSIPIIDRAYVCRTDSNLYTTCFKRRVGEERRSFVSNAYQLS
jgi:hypothetical protein